MMNDTSEKLETLLDLCKNGIISKEKFIEEVSKVPPVTPDMILPKHIAEKCDFLTFSDYSELWKKQKNNEPYIDELTSDGKKFEMTWIDSSKNKHAGYWLHSLSNQDTKDILSGKIKLENETITYSANPLTKQSTPLFVSEKTVLQIEQEAKEQKIIEKYNLLTEEQKDEIDTYIECQSTPSGKSIDPPAPPSFWSKEEIEQFFETITSEIEKEANKPNVGGDAFGKVKPKLLSSSVNSNKCEVCYVDENGNIYAGIINDYSPDKIDVNKFISGEVKLQNETILPNGTLYSLEIENLTKEQKEGIKIYKKLVEYNTTIPINQPISMTSANGFENIATYNKIKMEENNKIFISAEEKIALHRIRQELNGLFEALKGCSFLLTGSFLVKRMLEFYKDKKVNWENNDIDIFPYCEKEEIREASRKIIYEKLKKISKNIGGNGSGDSKFETTFGEVDLVRTTFKSPEDILDRFDFIHCMIGMTHDRVYLDADLEKSNCLFLLKNQRLTFHRYYSLYKIFQRTQKYANRGFSLGEFDLVSIANSIISIITKNKENTSVSGSSAFSLEKSILVSPTTISSFPFEPELFEKIKEIPGEKDFSFLDI
jgi:hypothetical protein